MHALKIAFIAFYLSYAVVMGYIVWIMRKDDVRLGRLAVKIYLGSLPVFLTGYFLGI